MKKILFLVTLFSLTAVVSVRAQAGVYLYINGITTGAGTGAHINEVQLSSAQNGISASSGSASVSDFVVSKSFDKSSMRLQFGLLSGKHITAVEIRYYNGQNVVAYSVKIEDALVTSQSQSNGGDGCSTGCQSISESYSFSGMKFTWTNFLTNPNQILIQDFNTNKPTFTE